MEIILTDDPANPPVALPKPTAQNPASSDNVDQLRLDLKAAQDTIKQLSADVNHWQTKTLQLENRLVTGTAPTYLILITNNC